MAQLQKKRNSKLPTQNQTLHTFFSATPLPTKSTTKARPQSKSKGKNSRAGDSNIIVIDSDSDDSVEFVETPDIKRRKLSLSPKRINISPVANEKSSTSHISCGPSSKYNGDSTLDTGKSEDSLKQSVASFGLPFLLIDAQSNDRIHRHKRGPTTSFGTPHLLLENTRPSSSPFVPSSSNADAFFVPITDEPLVDIDLTLGQWEQGNDEDISNDFMGYDAEVVNTEEGLRNNEAGTDAVNCFGGRQNFEEDENDLFDAAVQSTSSSVAHKTPLSNLTLKKEMLGYDRDRATDDDAFSVLMASHKQNEIWKEADTAKRMPTKRLGTKNDRRKAPFYKVLQGMPIAVDAFKYGAIPGVTAYFLTHAHSDHYTNLSSSWKHGPIYCSEGTANLIIHMLSVDRKWVHPLPMDVPTVIPNTNGVTVTLIEANHCPGSCLFFFEGCQTVDAGDSAYRSANVGSGKIFRYLHCGDFRASPRHVLHPAVKDKIIDHVYLDTTYLDPKYTFPPQPLVISACAELAKRLNECESTSDQNSTMLSWVSSSDLKGKGKERSRPLFVVGTYSIGKERIVKAIAHALNSKVYCNGRKATILRCEGDSELNALLTNNPREALVHLVPLGMITSDDLKRYLDRFQGVYTKIVGFRPTGWTYVPNAGKTNLPTIASIITHAASKRDFKYTDLKASGKSTTTLQVYPVPYSEHSSFYELTCFAMSLNWAKMIATVNVGSESSRGKMKQWVDRWEAERKKRVKDTIIPHRHPDYW